jgi:formamidopyrimidine-DNA glycosylase
MPELPDLEIIRGFLRNNIPGAKIKEVEVSEPLVLRCSAKDLIQDLKGRAFTDVTRRGKFLIFHLAPGEHLVFNLMLAGRLQYCPPGEKSRRYLCLRLRFSVGQELRYYDRKRMGRIYRVRKGDFSSIPQFELLGPEATDPAVDVKVFRQRIRRHPGMIKNILTNQRFLAGIGNAYADEILFVAGILPFRRRTSLISEELDNLHRALGEVLSWAEKELKARVGADIHVEVRDFLRIHGKGGHVCSVCGVTISEVTANRRRTNFCRGCQK